MTTAHFTSALAKGKKVTATSTFKPKKLTKEEKFREELLETIRSNNSVVKFYLFAIMFQLAVLLIIL